MGRKVPGRLEDGGWRMEDGGWRMEDGGWRMEDGGWRPVPSSVRRRSVTINDQPVRPSSVVVRP